MPYVNEKRNKLKLLSGPPALLIFDNFKAQTTSSFLQLLDSQNLDVVLLPANCTDQLQLLDLSVNKSKSVKTFMLAVSGLVCQEITFAIKRTVF